MVDAMRWHRSDRMHLLQDRAGKLILLSLYDFGRESAGRAACVSRRFGTFLYFPALPRSKRPSSHPALLRALVGVGSPLTVRGFGGILYL